MKNKFFIYTFAVFLTVNALALPGAALANGNNNNHRNDHNNYHKPLPPQSKGDNEHSDHHNPHYTSVPEFGFIPGLIATVSSAGAYLVLKRKSKLSRV